MQIELRTQVVRQLNLQYKTSLFRSLMTPEQMLLCVQQSLRQSVDLLDYDLTPGLVDRYGIILKHCQQSPFTQSQRQAQKIFIKIISELTQQSNNTIAILNKSLEELKDHIVSHGLTLKITNRYHLFKLYFRKISVKEAIVFQVLSKCHIFYTILRERKKSGKEFYLDPLINCYQNIKDKLEIVHSFHEKVLPRKQLRYFQKRNMAKMLKNTLFDAVSNKRYKEVKELIINGANIEQQGICQRSKRQMNCSHRASQLGDLQSCRILNSFKVNWDARDKQGYSPLHFAVQSGNVALVRYLIEEVQVDLQAVDIQERTPFYFVCTQGDLDIIRYLYAKGANINSKSKLGRSALSKACFLGLVDVVNFLISCPGIILNSYDTKGRTALHNSVFGPKGGRQGHKFGTNERDSPECTQILLQNGLDVNVSDFQQNTPMHVSMSSEGIDSIRVLLAFGASLTKLNKYEETPLMTGAKFGHIDSVKILIQQYGDTLLVKDAFGKNLMLLCAKFRQDDGKVVNQVFYYATNELLKMAANNYKLEDGKNVINEWQWQIHYTFQELLKEQQRVYVQFKYFAEKCIELNITINKLSIENIKNLILLFKHQQNEKDDHISSYFIKKMGQNTIIQINQSQLNEFLKCIILQNNTKMLQFIADHELSLKKSIKLIQRQEYELMEQLSGLSFKMLAQIKEKVLTYCLLKMNINWISYRDDQNEYNILHLLVRYKKLGTLIQILKVLSGVKLDFVTNVYVLSLLKEEESFSQKKQGGESPLSVVLASLLIHKNRQGFDPYNLAVLMKDASASKLLEQKLNTQTVIKKIQFEVKQYEIMLQDDSIQLQRFNMGYEIEQQLKSFTSLVEQASTHQELSNHFALIQHSPQNKEMENIDNFGEIWNNMKERRLVLLATCEQLQQLKEIHHFKLLGIDIEYFYSEGVTLMSIMQLSTIQTDYIIDFLQTTKDFQTSQAFINKASQMLRPLAYNRDIIKIMHGSDNDLCVIKSILKFSFVNFIDTAKIDIEIRQKQNIRGLATLVNEYLKEFMSKDYQVSEWRIRPIPSSMLEYARRDSMVLPFLARKMLCQMIFIGSKQAKRNKKASQPLIKSLKQR